MESKIYSICREICCRDIGAKDELIDSGLLNSYDLMELITILEEQFSVEFSVEEITETDNFSTMDHIVGLVKEKMKGSLR